MLYEHFTIDTSMILLVIGVSLSFPRVAGKGSETTWPAKYYGCVRVRVAPDIARDYRRVINNGIRL